MCATSGAAPPPRVCHAGCTRAGPGSPRCPASRPTSTSTPRPTSAPRPGRRATPGTRPPARPPRLPADGPGVRGRGRPALADVAGLGEQHAAVVPGGVARQLPDDGPPGGAQPADVGGGALGQRPVGVDPDQVESAPEGDVLVLVVVGGVDQRTVVGVPDGADHRLPAPAVPRGAGQFGADGELLDAEPARQLRVVGDEARVGAEPGIGVGGPDAGPVAAAGQVDVRFEQHLQAGGMGLADDPPQARVARGLLGGAHRGVVDSGLVPGGGEGHPARTGGGDAAQVAPGGGAVVVVRGPGGQRDAADAVARGGPGALVRPVVGAVRGPGADGGAAGGEGEDRRRDGRGGGPPEQGHAAVVGLTKV